MDLQCRFGEGIDSTIVATPINGAHSAKDPEKTRWS